MVKLNLMTALTLRLLVSELNLSTKMHAFRYIEKKVRKQFQHLQSELHFEFIEHGKNNIHFGMIVKLNGEQIYDTYTISPGKDIDDVIPRMVKKIRSVAKNST